MNKTPRLAALLASLLVIATPAVAQDYIVVSGGKKGDDFHAAATMLARHHKGIVIPFGQDELEENLEQLEERLRKIAPRYVAYVLRPEQIDFHVCRRLLQMATEIDADPFVDFEYGFITGATGAEAKQFVARSIDFEQAQDDVSYATVSGGLSRASMEHERKHHFRKSFLDVKSLYVAGKKLFPDEGRDREFMAKKLPGLSSCNLVMFIGHGVPREIVGGPDWRDLEGLELDGAVVLNVGCYTGVTSRFFESDWRERVLREKKVPAKESFALCLLRTGVIGYTAYTCPRPAGPELDTDLAYLVADGATLGAARRRDYDKTVLGYLGYGKKRLRLKRVRDGAKLHVTDAVRDMMLEGATGGILFGDPAMRPFAKREGDTPVVCRVEKSRGSLDIAIDCPAKMSNLVCNDPTARIGRFMAWKAYARVPLGKRHIRKVTVQKVQHGGKPAASHRLVWAFEQDHGEHFAQVKVIIERPEGAGSGDVYAELRIETCDDAKDAVRSGATVIPKAVLGKPRARAVAPTKVDVQSAKIIPAMRKRMHEWSVGEKALQAALDATKATLSGPGKAEMSKLAKFGKEGYRALCLLLEIGHHHYRTTELFESIPGKGHVRYLLRLRGKRPLPKFGDWTLMDALGLEANNTAEKYLMARLKNPENAGVFAACALGLSRRKNAEALKIVGARLLEMVAEEKGLHPMMIKALARFGNAEAADYLERYAETHGATAKQLAESAARVIRGK